ncbi:long-chain acyl-CoA synthetase [Antricoccus suffuscus]|uniref:Long-chain acyl-CoA synthetase n=1 Tax=Antricoccus suffuscus TaxID=1629062 RepID=A0A2T0ZSI6_9ACTN|nr:AMP-binding protein [Antricoccus suffuscus]PRZ39058.1 long-chain acyl-CoA synthetase [Antricoccus suffuscus]
MTDPVSTDERPWLKRYPASYPSGFEPEYANLAEVFAATVARDPDATIVRYFDFDMSVAQLDAASDAVAAGLTDHGIVKGDRVALYLQNIPQFLIAMIGVFKVGAAIVTINPMNRQRELAYQLKDSGAKALVCLQSLYDVAAEVVPDTDVALVLTTSELRYQTRNDQRVLGKSVDVATGGSDLEEFIERYRGVAPPAPQIDPEDLAGLCYTSGTTGEPKGAMLLHRNLIFAAQNKVMWNQITPTDAVYAVAPFFHLTGLINHLFVGMYAGIPIAMTFRFDPIVGAEEVRDKRLTLTTGPITIFIAWLNNSSVKREHLASMRQIASGGAPVPPQIVADFEEKFGKYIQIGYGMTESSAGTHTVPIGMRAPIDPASNAISVGLPVFNTMARVIDDQGVPLPPGVVGQLQVEGPGVIAGYWQLPEATAEAMPRPRCINTGDIGMMDEDGWFYIVDRMKDMISASGFKVWPREVEDVLYSHPAVREAAVVGVPDDYRGETVKAVVSLAEGKTATAAEIQEFCKAQMAVYKYPRFVEIVDELPKNASGKILRRELRLT